MRIYSRTTQAIGMVAALAVLSWASPSRAQTVGATPVIPDNATALEGLPSARLDATGELAKRQRLDREQAATQALKITIVDGRYYWTSRESLPLTLTTSGEFTYLTSTEPGQYVRFRKINDRLSYVEHIDMGFGSVTYWGNCGSSSANSWESGVRHLLISEESTPDNRGMDHGQPTFDSRAAPETIC